MLGLYPLGARVLHGLGAHAAYEARLSDGSSARYDLVVAADGMHSDTRALVLREDDFAYRETGWGGWVYWAASERGASDAFRELWGDGWFLGQYPVKERLGVFLGGWLARVKEPGLRALAERVAARLDQPAPVLQDLPDDPDEAYLWSFHDVRASRWRAERVVLLGDAAAGFLPTAGVGASMAMESAAVLADELSRVDAAHVELALELFEKRHRARVEAAQESSRRMARWMFLDARWLGRLRDALVRRTSAERLVQDVARILDEPI
jgi:2-polyprenyl-6-methoxyphenol hydroxylase-like FAD-dependent oxidoreductase